MTQEATDAIMMGGIEAERAMLFGQMAQQSQQEMNQQQAMAGLQQTAAMLQGMGGANDPLSGIPRDRPYWESMFGNLGMQDTLFHQRRGGK